MCADPLLCLSSSSAHRHQQVDEGTRDERIALLDELGFEWKPRLPKKELVRCCFGMDRWMDGVMHVGYGRWAVADGSSSPTGFPLTHPPTH